jgi:ankyrin repeat protein
MDIDIADKDGKTSLAVAAFFGHAAVVNSLLERGANANSQNKFGETPLHWAVTYGYEEVIRNLLENGVQVNLRNSVGEAPLHLLC